MSNRLSEDGQVTIPQDVRDRLGLVPGDQVRFDRDQDGRILVEKVAEGFAGAAGILRRHGEGLTGAELIELLRGEGDASTPSRFELARRRRAIRGITTEELMRLTRGRE